MYSSILNPLSPKQDGKKSEIRITGVLSESKI